MAHNTRHRSMRIATVAAASALALLLSACSSGDSGTAQADGQFTWAMWVGGSADKAEWQKVADLVKEDHPDLSVTVQGAPWNDYWTKLGTQLTSPSAPCIVSMQSLRLANFTQALRPLDDLVDGADVKLEEFDRVALEGMEVGGKLYALPYDTGPQVIFYNKDLFDKAGVDAPEPGWTVDEFESAAQDLDDAGIAPLGSTVGDAYVESLVLAATGGRILSEDGEVVTTDPKFAAGLEWLSHLREKGYMTKASGSDMSGSDNGFLAGKIAMNVNGPWGLIDVKNKADFSVGLATLPAGPDGPQTFASGSGFGISKQCKDPEGAMKAIATMTGEKALTSLATSGRAFAARTAAQPAWYETASIDGAETVIDFASESALPLPSSKQGEQLNRLFTQYLPQVINGTSSPDEALKQISSQTGGH